MKARLRRYYFQGTRGGARGCRGQEGGLRLRLVLGQLRRGREEGARAQGAREGGEDAQEAAEEEAEEGEEGEEEEEEEERVLLVLLGQRLGGRLRGQGAGGHEEAGEGGKDGEQSQMFCLLTLFCVANLLWNSIKVVLLDSSLDPDQ